MTQDKKIRKKRKEKIFLLLQLFILSHKDFVLKIMTVKFVFLRVDVFIKEKEAAVHIYVWKTP